MYRSAAPSIIRRLRSLAVLFMLSALTFNVLFWHDHVSATTGINQQLNFQGRLYNAQGAVVPDGYYNIQFKIYQDGPGTAINNPGGTLEWTEDWLNSSGNGVKVVNGFISVQLGSITPFGTNVDWNQDTLWLSMNIGSTNTTCTPFTSCTPDGEMVPMKRLSSTPYALNAGMLGGKTAADFIQNQNIAAQTASNFWIDGTAKASTVSAVVQQMAQRQSSYKTRLAPQHCSRPTLPTTVSRSALARQIRQRFHLYSIAIKTASMALTQAVASMARCTTTPLPIKCVAIKTVVGTTASTQVGQTSSKIKIL